MASIVDIRLERFISDQPVEDFIKLYALTGKQPERFTTEFFALATRSALARQNIPGLLRISQLLISLDRLIESEYTLTKAYEINSTNREILYALVDIFCRRHCLFHANHFVEALSKDGDDILTTKSRIKYWLITGHSDQLKKLILDTYSRYIDDREYLLLAFEAAISLNDYFITAVVSRSSHAVDLYGSLSGRSAGIVRRHLNIALLTILTKVSNRV